MILDALKRAERERKLEKAPDLSAIYQEEGLHKRKAKQWFWLGGAVLVVFVALAIVFWPKEPPKPTLTASTSAKVAPPKSSSAPKPAAKQNAKSVSPTSAALSSKKRPLKTQKMAPVSDDVFAEQAPESTGFAAQLPNETIADPEPAPEPVKQPVALPVREKRSAQEVKVVPGAKPKEGLPSFDDLPEDIQSVPGPLEINVHMYSPKPSERRVFINMRGYREGDVIGESGYKLVEITSNGVVIDYGKGRALLKVKRK